MSAASGQQDSAGAGTAVAAGTEVAVGTSGGRRWPMVIVGVLLLVLVLGFVGIGWYTSGLLGAEMVSEHEPDQTTLIINRVERTGVERTGVERTGMAGGTVAYTMDADASGWHDVGLMAIAADGGGWTLTSGPIDATGRRGAVASPAAGPEATATAQGTGEAGAAARRMGRQQAPPPLAAGQRGYFEGEYYYRDPRAGLGLPYRDVVIDTDLGPAPAWFVPPAGGGRSGAAAGGGDKDTWAIVVHGRNGARTEGLRALRTLAARGHPTLLITYRNDEGAPVGDGLLRFGYSEWRDLEAAVRYSLDHGARRVFLVGYSMGGGISLAFMANSSLSGSVNGMFLDSPIASVPQAIDLASAEMGLPGPLVSWGKWIAEHRFGIDYAAVDYTAVADRYAVPTTVVASAEDDTVDPVITRDLAAAINTAHPGTATYEVFPRAEHTGAWNVDRPRYDRLLRDTLARASG